MAMSVHILCVGKLKESFYRDACAEYVKRLGAYCRLTVVELPEEYAEVWQVDSIPEEEDTQLKRAKEVLRQEMR